MREQYTDSVSLPSFDKLIQMRSSEHSGKIIYSFYPKGEDECISITYSELDQKIKTVASKLQQLNLKGERVLLLYPSGLEYIIGFFACLYAGVIAVPLYPPETARMKHTLERIYLVMKDSGANNALITREIFNQINEKGQDYNINFKNLNWIISDEINPESENDWRETDNTLETIAYLQYTSGSTGTPKGVIIKHRNLLSNADIIHKAFEFNSRSTIVMWLPLYHDMGLIGSVIQPIFSNSPINIFPTISFLEKPFRWLKMISDIEVGEVMSGGPNFAYDLCIKRTNEEQRNSIDLSNWNAAFSGSEPVRSTTINAFVEAFGGSGFKRSAFYPCYGLAEATLFVTGGDKFSEPIEYYISKKELEKHKIKSAAAAEADALNFIGCGKTFLDEKVFIVDPVTENICGPNAVGEVWVKGESISSGYWGKTKLSKEILNAELKELNQKPFLRTGDLGFIKDGELFITGRLKDLIIIRGSNHYPQDIELTVEESTDLVRPGFGAAFSVEAEGEERLVIVYEAKPRKENWPEIIQKIKDQVSINHNILAYDIALVKPKSVPKTSSGKIRRQSCKNLYLEYKFNIVCSLLKDNLTEEKIEIGENPKNPFELKVIQLLTGHFDKSFNLDNSLISLGIDSLKAVELKNEIETVFNIHLSLEDLLLSPTVKDIIEKIKNASQNKPINRLIRREHSAGSELSINQQSLWTLYNISPSSSAYNEFFAFRIINHLSIDNLKSAVEKIAEKHSALKMKFSFNNGKPRQIINNQNIDFEIISLNHLDEKDIYKIIVAQAHQPFNITNENVFKVRLYKTTHDFILLFMFHHICVDLWSIQLIIDEIKEIYHADINNSINKNGSQNDYEDFVEWQLSYIQSAEAEKDFEFWRQNLSHPTNDLNLPADYKRPLLPTYKGASYSFGIQKQISEKLKTLAAENNITLFSALIALYAILLHKLSGQDNFNIGFPASGRTKREFQNVVGYFVNSLVLPSRLIEKQKIKNLFKRSSFFCS